MSDMWGGYGTGFDQSVLAQLLPYIFGSLSDQKGVLDVQQKGANNIQDLIKLLFDPQFAMMTGTFDPMLSVPSTDAQAGLMLPTPLLDAAARSGDPTVQSVAAMVKSGEIADPMVAYKTLFTSTSDSSSALYGLTPDQVKSTVDDWFGEMAQRDITLAKTTYDNAGSSSSSSSKPKDMWAAAGIPNPTEQYYANYDKTTGVLDTNAPLSAGVQDRLKKSNDAMARTQQAYEAYLKQHPDYRGPVARQTAADQVAPLTDASKSAAQKVSNDQMGISLAELPSFLDQHGLGGKRWAETFDMAKLRSAADANGGLVPWKVLSDTSSNGPLSQWGHNNAGIRSQIQRLMDDWQRQQTSDRIAQNKTAAEWSGRGAQEAARNSSSKASDPMGDGQWLNLQNAKLGNQYASGQAVGETLAMQALGRTPTQDNMQRRIAMLKAMGLF